MNKLCEFAKQYAPLAGRILLALMFVISGWGKITNFSGTAGYMASMGMPFPELLLPGAIAIELGCGLMLMAGWKTRFAALAIFLFIIPSTLIFHNFWAADPAQAQNQMIHFMKNVTIMGGMLYVMAFGAGPLSLDNRKSG
ncbi:MAG TPA: DoxX family protein [Burkholderiales bacterium]|nr:DoxX family protein [Burkholderiales bacterium]